MLRRGRLPILLLLAAHAPLLLRFLWDRIQEPFYWPAFIGAGFAAAMAQKVPAENARWTVRGGLLIVLDVVLLTAAVLTNSAWLAAAAAWLLLLSLCISTVNRQKTSDFSYLAIYPLFLLSLPPDLSRQLWPLLLKLQTSVSSYAASDQGLYHFREGSQLSVLSGMVDVQQVAGGIFSWPSLALLVLLWGSLQRRSCVQSLLMMPAVLITGFVANLASVILLLSIMAGPGGVSPSTATYLLVTAMMLVPSLLFLFSAEAAMIGLTMPIPLNEEPAETDDGRTPALLSSMCSPLVYHWNSLVSSMPMDPLNCVTRHEFQMPRGWQVICLWLTPVVFTAQCIRLFV
jgi:hypothetical protein